MFNLTVLAWTLVIFTPHFWALKTPVAVNTSHRWVWPIGWAPQNGSHSWLWWIWPPGHGCGQRCPAHWWGPPGRPHWGEAHTGQPEEWTAGGRRSEKAVSLIFFLKSNSEFYKNRKYEMIIDFISTSFFFFLPQFISCLKDEPGVLLFSIHKNLKKNLKKKLRKCHFALVW